MAVTTRGPLEHFDVVHVVTDRDGVGRGDAESAADGLQRGGLGHPAGG